LSVAVFVTSCVRVTSSEIRSKTAAAVFKVPACTWRRERAFATFDEAFAVRLMALLNFIETASPPASSAAVEIREPLERRARLFWRRSLDFWRLNEASVEDVFVLMEIIL
jgi:hypothetical protein